MAGSSTQLMCTFTSDDKLVKTIETIANAYSIAFNKIYILENVDDPKVICCTYNINTNDKVNWPAPDSTISLHRKKISNSLYTINAINKLVAELNGGVEDKNFSIPWENYRNSILVTAYGSLKIIKTKIRDIVDIVHPDTERLPE